MKSELLTYVRGNFCLSKNLGDTSFFKPISQCLDNGRNTPSGVGFITSYLGCSSFQDRMNAINYMRHQFIPMHFHMPTNCDSCSKPLWHMFKPPPAVECKRK